MDARAVTPTPPPGFRLISSGPPMPEPPPGFRILADEEPPRRSKFEELDTMVRGAADMATFGFADELAAAGDTYLNPFNHRSYSENVAAQRARDQYDAETLPWTRFAGQAVGALAMPAFGVAQLAQAARAGGPVFREGAKLGLTQGALYGAGSADPAEGASLPEAIGERAIGAAKGGVTGAVAGGALAKGGQLAGRLTDAVGKTVYNAASPRRAATAAFNRELQASGTSADELLQRVLPGHRNLSPQQQVRAFEILGEEMQRAPRGALTRTAQRMAQEMGGTPTGAERRLSAMRGRYDEDLGGSPLTAAELPSIANAPRIADLNGDVSDEAMMAFDETPARQLLDTLANSGGEAASQVSTRLAARQMGTRGRLQAALADAVGGEDFHALAQSLDDQLSQAGTAAYQAAFQAERPVAPLLEQVMARLNTRIGQRSGVVRDALLRAREEFYRELSVPGQPPARQVVDSLQQAMDARGVLNNMIEAAQSQPGNGMIARALTQLHREVTAALRHTNPQWWQANQIWGDARSGQMAMQLGEEFAMRAGPQLRQSLAIFDRMPPAMQQRFRVAHMQKLHDLLSNANDTVDLSRLFRKQAVRDAVRHVHGDEAANRLIRRIRDETIATSTNRLTGNSRTALRLESRDRLNADTDIAGAAQMLTPGGVKNAMLERASRFLADRRNVPLAQMATTPVARPEQLIPLLNRLAQARTVAQAPRGPAWAVRGGRAGAFGNAMMQDWSRR